MARQPAVRWRAIAIAAAAALAAAITLWYRLGARDTSTPPAVAMRSTATVRAGDHSAAISSATAPMPATTPASTAAARPWPTPSVVDLAAVRPLGTPHPSGDAERFRTTAWFTEDDLRHPERYFERAEHMPELNRSEERHDALAFFIAYRQKLERDLAATAGDEEKRRDVEATIARYDAAIARLRAEIGTP